MIRPLVRIGAVIGLCAVTFLVEPATSAAIDPKELWKDYDPDAGDFREEIVADEIKDGIRRRDSYISAYVLGEEIRVWCQYAVRQGTTQAPGLLNVHGWMGAASIPKDYVADGWAVMSFDYCGRTGDRKEYTKYPASLRHGNMDAAIGKVVRSQLPDGASITDPRQTSDYLWYAIQFRVLSYLERQAEVDRDRIGAAGYSYGGTLMWPLGTDRRVKAIVPHFGIGYNEYWRSRQVWLYNDPSVEPPRTPGEAIYLESIAPEAYVPFITAATLFLNGSNDHHGGHERGLESFKRFKAGVPWAFAIQARGHHDTDKIEQDCRLWLEKHVAGRDVAWPAHPRSEIRLDAEGVPELVVAPAWPAKVTKVEMFHALKTPCSFNRSWRDAPATRVGDAWVAKLPVLNVADYVFGYANITYDSTIVLSTDFEAVIPTRLGAARATDRPTRTIAGGAGGYAAWSNVAELEGPGGVAAFRCTNNRQGSRTEQFGDPKWRAPPASQLAFRFHCTEPQTVILSADSHVVELEIPASDRWQSLTIPTGKLATAGGRPLQDWSGVSRLQLSAKPGSDLTRVLFADFTWVAAPP